ncbi:MAG: alpha-galactosidase [Phycisphaerales bacterium]
MNKRIMMPLIVALSFSSMVNAGLFWSAGSGDWNSGSSWDVGHKPAAGDQAIVLWNHTITVTGNEYAGLLNLGYVANGWINIAAGGSLTTQTMHVGQTAEGNLEVGTMNVYGTAYADQLFVANERANGRGVLNVYSGGVMRVGTWHCNIGNNGTQAGAGGRVYLKGTGRMEVNAGGGIVMTANGYIDIEAGEIKVLGDYRTQLQGYINNGMITSNGGNSPHCIPVVSFIDGYTYVKTGGCTCLTYLPADLNHDCYVDVLDLTFFAENWLDSTIVTASPDEAIMEGYPFSFNYGGESSKKLLPKWTMQQQTSTPQANSTKITTTWRDPASGLKVTFEKIKYSDFLAVDWLLYFENAGTANTGIISDIQVLDTSFTDPSYILHRTNGGIPDPNQFEVSTMQITKATPRTLSTVNGTPSTKDLPFLTIDTANSTIIMGIGWTGNWNVSMESPDDIVLNLKASMGRTNFYLYPGEKVRTPRILAMVWEGEKIESNSQFRQLIYKHYSPELSGQKLLPIATCNTGYTHMELGGFWDVETTEQNHIYMINAYSQLGIKYMVTDAGWMQDCGDVWTNGMGSWVPRTDHYPNGVKPVADAAEAVGIKWGLWMTPEMANPGTIVYTQHPEWLAGGYCMVDFGKQAVIDYMYNIVDGFMKLSPGFRVYRTDGGFVPPIEPEGASRVGIMEMKYVMGLYQFWDRIIANYPDAFLYGCDCGGQRIDLEMIKRFHVNQKTDYFSVNDVDQASIWALSQYLPNNLIDVPLVRMDDYTFHSTFASSLNLGWTADQPGFDMNKAKSILAKYNSLAPRLIGSWYPLLPYSRAATVWMASQYHRADLEQGIVLAFRHSSNSEPTKTLKLYGLTENSNYTLYFNSTGQTITRTGAQLMAGLNVSLNQAKSELIEYQKQ